MIVTTGPGPPPACIPDIHALYPSHCFFGSLTNCHLGQTGGFYPRYSPRVGDPRGRPGTPPLPPKKIIRAAEELQLGVIQRGPTPLLAVTKWFGGLPPRPSTNANGVIPPSPDIISAVLLCLSWVSSHLLSVLLCSPLCLSGVGLDGRSHDMGGISYYPDEGLQEFSGDT